MTKQIETECGASLKINKEKEKTLFHKTLLKRALFETKMFEFAVP